MFTHTLPHVQCTCTTRNMSSPICRYFIPHVGATPRAVGVLMSDSAGAPSPAAAEGATASDTEATAEDPLADPKPMTEDPLADPNLTPEKPFLDQKINLENTEPLTDQKSVNEVMCSAMVGVRVVVSVRACVRRTRESSGPRETQLAFVKRTDEDACARFDIYMVILCLK